MYQTPIYLGNQISIQDVVDVSLNNRTVDILSDCKKLIIESSNVVNEIVESDLSVYGINTGFGVLSDKKISKDDLSTLQRNLILSHAVGCGEPAPEYIVRSMLFLRLVSLCKGNSGVQLTTILKLIEYLNANLYPYVPIQGTVGASGDLAPLSHLFSSFLGEGKMFCYEKNRFIPSSIVLERKVLTPLELGPKEGLALNNGTQFITSYTLFAVYNSLKLLNIANLVSCFSVEVLHGTDKFLDHRIHLSKPHHGQQKVASDMRDILLRSENIEKNTTNKVQDAYSLRCIPQIHGAAYDAIKFAEKIVTTEINSSTDNPLIFTSHLFNYSLKDKVVSGGNFHGMYIGMAADMLAIANTYLCNISERRLERILNPDLNKYLPAFLSRNNGLNSGLMITQYASAGITAENRTLSNPGSVNNIPTCGGFEDVVSMAGWPARKALQSSENTFKVLSYELFACYCAKQFTKEKMSPAIENLYTKLSMLLPDIDLDYDQYMFDHVHTINIFLQDFNISE